MKVIAARVVDGRIDVAGEVPDGAAIAVLIAGEDGFRLSDADEDELSAALHEIRSGAYVDGDALLAEIRGFSSR